MMELKMQLKLTLRNCVENLAPNPKRKRLERELSVVKNSGKDMRGYVGESKVRQRRLDHARYLWKDIREKSELKVWFGNGMSCLKETRQEGLCDPMSLSW